MGYFLSLSKETTEHWLNASELMLLVCGLVLAYGAAGEYLEEHGKLPRWMRWAREPKLVFVWMVAISLFGEFSGDAGVYIFSGQLQTISDTELTQLKNENLRLQGQVGDAKKAVIKAQGAADGAVADEKLLSAKLSDATLKEEAEQARPEQEERKTSDIQGKAVQAQATLDEYVKESTSKLGTRIVERSSIASALKGKSNHVVAGFWYEPNNFEAYVFAWSLYRALGAGTENAPGAEWNVTPPIPIPADIHLPEHPRSCGIFLLKRPQSNKSIRGSSWAGETQPNHQSRNLREHGWMAV
jgi:hypothetical protein